MGSGLKWCKVRLNYYVFGLNAVSGLVRVWGSIRVGMADGGGSCAGLGFVISLVWRNWGLPGELLSTLNHAP